jgi:pimeloyl-ACP methyl ester carboxylesterase
VRVQRPRAVIAHGSGSSPDFVRRAFGPALDDAGFALVALDERSGDVSVVLAALRSAVESTGAVLVGGVSLGAHAAALLAAERGDLAGVLLVLPAWSGPPNAVARLSATAADDVERRGLAAAVARVADQGLSLIHI